MKLRNREEVLGRYKVKDNSTPSYSFVYPENDGEVKSINPKKKKMLTLIKTFGIEDIEVFQKAFEQVTSGKGHELDNILTLHSSALFALLMFYDISANNPMIIDKYEFDTVFFEVENNVFVEGIDCSDDNPSSVDVALFDSKSEVLLLLEVKLTEPLKGNKERLKSKYNEWIKNNISPEDQAVIGYADGFLQAKDGNSNRGSLLYNGGVKQLIAHFIGAAQGPSKDNNHKDCAYNKIYEKAKEIFLATFLLSPESDLFSDNKNDIKKLSAYKKHILTLGEILGKIQPSKVSPNMSFVLTPDDIKKHTILPSIKKFYRIDINSQSL